MPVRETPLPQLDIPVARSISPGGCPSAGDVDMASPTSWASLPDRPRTSESRRPSFSVSNAPDSIPPSAWRVQPGQYVAFTLDTEAVAATTAHSDGSNEKNAIINFPVGRYIGLVVGSYVQRADDNMGWLEELIVLYVARVPPAVAGAEGFYLPIAPFQTDTDGSRRPPIQTRTLFPWKDRVQWTTFGTRLQIQRLHESKLMFDMDEDEFSRCENRVSADMDNTEQVLANGGDIVRNAVDKLRPPSEPLPATVWRDIRGEHTSADPTEFVSELYALDELMQRLAASQVSQ
ncbi:hypothetical protein C2E23DRAFT_886296 [Lenzites betulinus]|nr:hypothetical protein C2E23DRAFT_886296 [Lenzites betulinus]